MYMYLQKPRLIAQLLSVLNFVMSKLIILTIAVIIGQVVHAQHTPLQKRGIDSFYLNYSIAGLGADLGRFEPTLKIHGNKFIYTREQNSYLFKRSKKKQLISKGLLRETSIDSILCLLQDLKDTAIFESNPCIMGGGITEVIIAYGGDTTKFTLGNTMHVVVLKIIDIINPYLPDSNKLYGSAEAIKRQEECLANILKKARERSQDSTGRKQ